MLGFKKKKKHKNKNKNKNKIKNVPQIVIQWMYLDFVGQTITQDLTTLISFIFSVLSIIISCVIFALNFQEMTEGFVFFVFFLFLFFVFFYFLFVFLFQSANTHNNCL